jgi:hypothetical protein
VFSYTPTAAATLTFQLTATNLTLKSSAFDVIAATVAKITQPIEGQIITQNQIVQI